MLLAAGLPTGDAAGNDDDAWLAANDARWSDRSHPVDVDGAACSELESGLSVVGQPAVSGEICFPVCRSFRGRRAAATAREAMFCRLQLVSAAFCGIAASACLAQ